MIAVARATLSEQPSPRRQGAIVSGRSPVLCKGNDRRKMPLRGGRSRRALVRQAPSSPSRRSCPASVRPRDACVLPPHRPVGIPQQRALSAAPPRRPRSSGSRDSASAGHGSSAWACGIGLIEEQLPPVACPIVYAVQHSVGSVRVRRLRRARQDALQGGVDDVFGHCAVRHTVRA